MKKILALVLVTLLLMFSLAGCTQADNLVHLETFYDKFKEDCFLYEYSIYNADFDALNKEICQLANVEKGSPMYNDLLNRDGVAPDTVIYAIDSYFVFAQEYSSVRKAKKAWNRYYKENDFYGMYVLYKNIIATTFSVYDWLIDYPKELLETGEIVMNESILYLAPQNLGSEYVIPSQIETVTREFLPSGNTVSKVDLNKVKYIEVFAFWGERISEVAFGSSTLSIGACAFIDCANLKTVVIPENVKFIGYGSFSSGTIYVEGYKQKPDAWSEQFAAGDAKVYWAGEWHYDDNGNPTPNN